MNLCGKIISIFAWLHCSPVLVAMFFIFALTNRVYAQTEKSAGSVMQYAPGADTMRSDTDSTHMLPVVNSDSLKKDSIASRDTSKRGRLEQSLGIKISKDALPSV